MEYVNKLDEYPKDLFSKSFEEIINKTRKLFKNYEEYINKPMVKCCVLGNVSSGKSTVINALLERDILYEGVPEGTLCIAKCQPSLNNEEYFEIYTGNVRSNQRFDLSEIKQVNKGNPSYSKYSMNLNNHLDIYLDIYLNIPRHEILQNFLIIDCPGFDINNLEAISKYCRYADIIIFCFRAREGITDKDIDRIKQIKSRIGKFQINFIINCCDECDSIDKQRIIYKLSPHLTGEDAIFFISAREEKHRNWNGERHREFELFKECLQKQKSLAAITYRAVYLDLISSVDELLSCLNFGTFQNYQFSDKRFVELQEQIFRLINDDRKLYYKNDRNIALMDYSHQVNKEISKFMVKQFNNDYKLNDGIIDENYFFKRFIPNDAISKPNFSWFEFGEKSSIMKKCFVDHFIANSTTLQRNIEQNYRERVQQKLIELEDYKNELKEIIKNIRRVMF